LDCGVGEKFFLIDEKDHKNIENTRCKREAIENYFRE
jgi:hypothetical protein